ncbi:MAG: AAA family ATPase, partial [Anaerolineae bacterium]|nr:AAA family ATPase [Anaerolineae bacterium]
MADYTPLEVPATELSELPLMHPGRPVGRDTLIKELYDSARQNRPILLYGERGVGKTALAAALSAAFIQQPGGVLWLDGQVPTFAALLVKIGRAYGLDDVTQSQKPGGLVGMVASSLMQHRPLVVIDNLETVADTTALLPFLRQLANPSKFLLTSRWSLQSESGIFCYSLHELNTIDALAFLRHEAEVRGIQALIDARQAQLERIYGVVGGNPLALKLVIGQARFLPLTQVLTNLQEAQGHQVHDLYTYIYWQAWQLLDDAGRRLLLVLPVESN